MFELHYSVDLNKVNDDDDDDDDDDIRTEMVEYEICSLTSALSHFAVYFCHVVDNIGEDLSRCT